MIVRALDALGDWTFGKGRNDYFANNAAIIQNIATRLNSYLGDCFFALDAGIDWFNLLGTKNPQALELAVRAVILNTVGVTSLVDVLISVDETSRKINMTYTVETVYSAVNNAGAVPIVGTSSFLLTEDGNVLTTEDGGGLIAG